MGFEGRSEKGREKSAHTGCMKDLKVGHLGSGEGQGRPDRQGFVFKN